MSNSFVKDPTSVLDFIFDWSQWLAAGETLTAASCAVRGNLPAITVDHVDRTATGVTAWLAGGTVGSTYFVSCAVSTNQGRTDERSIRIIVRDR